MKIIIEATPREMADLMRDVQGKPAERLFELRELIAHHPIPNYIISPGGAVPLAGSPKLGFFGEVPAANLITGDALCKAIGLNAGVSQHSDSPWLKFTKDGQVLYVAKKPIRHSVSWDDINAAGAVFGEKIVNIDRRRYAVTLLSSEEWNLLICPIHEDYGQWAQYTDADILVRSSYGNGSYTWTSTPSGSSTRVLRGIIGVSYSSDYSPDNASTDRGFRPVLRAL